MEGTLDPRQLYVGNVGDNGRPQMNSLPQQLQTQTQSRNVHVPTVHEALPYTPFSSIVPFNPDIMPPPLAFSNTAPTAFQDMSVVQSAQSELRRLTQGAKSAEQASSRCRKTLEDVQRLLDGENIIQFKFKKTKRPAPADAGQQLPAPKLSPFAKLVLDTTAVEYKYLTPSDEQSQSANKPPANVPQSSRQPRVILGPAPVRAEQVPSQSTPQPTPMSTTKQAGSKHKASPGIQQQHQRPVQQQKPTSVGLVPVIPRPSQSSQTSYTQDGLGLPVSKQVTPQQSKVHSSVPQQTPKAYVALGSLTPAQREKYQRVPDSSMGSASSRNQSAYLTNSGIKAPHDQRAISDGEVENLRNYLQTIFEAEDQMQPDTSGEAKQDSTIFVTRDTGDGPALVLQPDIQSKLQGAFNKVVSANRLDDIDVESLVRVQRVCERSISALGSSSLSIGDDWSAEDVRDWSERVSNAESGMLAGRTLLHIMTGGSHRKEVQSESSLTTVLDAIRIVVETCIIPIIEERASVGEKVRGDKGAPTNLKFIVAAQNRQELLSVLQAANKLLLLLGKLFVKTNVDESAISSLEYLCKMLIFAENGTNERDSALGLQSYETLRKTAMDAMAKIFTKYPKERPHILDEILMSLEKLPANKQGACQFAISGSKPIQLVSALLMRLVQTSATPSGRATADDCEEESEDDSEVEGSDEESDDSESPRKKKARQSKAQLSASGLPAAYKPLQQSANNHAAYIVRNLLSRALGTAKSSDEPYRKLLDIFVDDFINVLGLSDWPAAEVLLRALVVRLVSIAEEPKSSAPFRTLALELLGTIGSAIIDMQSHVSNAAKALDDDDELSRRLVRAARDFSNNAITASQLTSFEGPYRILIESFHARSLDDPQLYSARGYHLVQWAEQVCSIEMGDDVSTAEKKSNLELQARIKHMMDDRHWLESNFDFGSVSTAQGKLASKIVTANSQLCRAFGRIFKNILASMRSEQPTVRSRGLKSVTTLLEQDSSILDRDAAIMRQIVYCLGDSSSMVRDSALQLIQKCVALQPTLELKVYEKVAERTTDANSPVRKRAMAFLKQVYLNTHDNKVKAKISNAMISRIHDVDENVAEVARTTIEEIWFSAFKSNPGQETVSVDSKLQMQSHAALIVQTVDLGDNVAMVLEVLMRELLVKSKQAAENGRICKALVAVLFDGVVDNTDIPGAPAQSAILRTLTVFAKAGPRLFNSSQLELLEPYAKNLRTTDDLEIYPFVVTILQYTLPVLTGVNLEFLASLQTHLLQAVQKLPKEELAVVAPCLWTIVNVLNNPVARLVPFVVSVVRGVASLQIVTLKEEDKSVAKACKLLTIMGQFGKACHLDAYISSFTCQQQLAWYKGTSVADLMVQIACKFTSPKQPQTVREAALEAVCAIGYNYPKTFFRDDVVNAIEFVFTNREQALESVLLSGLEVFIRAGEKGAEDDSAPELGSGVESGTQRLVGTYQATGSDVAYTSLSQRFLPDFLRIALSSMDDVALCAGKIIASINTQGIAHPGKSAPGLVALQTCPNPSIAKMAFLSYKSSWEKHESTLEKTLMLSIQYSFDYQQKVIQNTNGCTGHPPSSKLHYFWDVLKTGKAKPRAKFFTNLCAGLDFDLAKLDSVDSLAKHLLFVRFCVEAIGFLDYEYIGEILHILGCLEKVFAGTGTTVAQAIESEVFKLIVPASSTIPPSDAIVNDNDADMDLNTVGVATVAAPAALDPARLMQLTIAAQILSTIWETRTLLRRKWMLTKYIGKPKLAAKDDRNKAVAAPTAPGIADAYQNKVNAIMTSANDQASQQATCRAFVELMSVDTEVKAADGAEDDGMDVDDDDDAHSEGSANKSPAPRGKKRKSMEGHKGPPKKKGRPRKSSVTGEDGDWD